MLTALDKVLMEDSEHESMFDLCTDNDDTLDGLMESFSPIEETRELFPVDEEVLEVISK